MYNIYSQRDLPITMGNIMNYIGQCIKLFSSSSFDHLIYNSSYTINVFVAFEITVELSVNILLSITKKVNVRERLKSVLRIFNSLDQL